jgi:hypothetical protein
MKMFEDMNFYQEKITHWYDNTPINIDRRLTDRRSPNQRIRTSDNKRVFFHEIWNDPEVDINNPKRLKMMSDVEVMTWLFEKDNLIIRKYKNWTVTLKHAPFSSKDLMVVYTWKSSKLTNMAWLKSNWVINELFEILENLLIGVNYEKIDLINHEEEELCIWNNVTITPWSWEAQSLREIHLHFTIFPIVEWLKNNVKTVIETIWDYKNVFPLNKINLTLIRLLETHLNAEWIDTKRKINLDNHDNLALEIDLWDNKYFLWNKNYILYIYKEINKFNKSLNLWTINNLLKKVDFEFVHNRISYSIWFSYRNWKLFMRIRYSYRNKLLWERWWSAANWLHMVSRKAGIPSPDLIPFKESIMKIIK